MKTGLICVLMLSINVLAAFVFGYQSEQLTYHGQLELNWWFSISTHFSHHSANHLISNMAALFILLWLFPISLRKYLCGILLTMIAVRVFVGVYSIHTYLGFSALLFVLPGHHVIKILFTRNYPEAVAISIIMIWHLQLLFVNDNQASYSWITLNGAHLLGFMAGALVGCLCLKKSNPKSQINLNPRSLNPLKLGRE